MGISFVLDRLGRGDPMQSLLWAEHPILGKGGGAEGGLRLAQQMPKLPSHNRVRRCRQISFTGVRYHESEDRPAGKSDEGGGGDRRDAKSFVRAIQFGFERNL